MSLIQLYLIEVDKNKDEAERIVSQSAAQLESKQLRLIDLITSLEEYINNKEDGAQRAKTVAYLADVLSVLPARVLSVQERRLLVTFILGRIEGDTQGIDGSARALIALENLGRWDAETAQNVMRQFIDYTSPLRQFKLQTERYPVAQLVDLLMAKYRDAIQQIHKDDPAFLEKFIAYFEGEKDPRNLMVVFSLLQVPMTEWDIHSNAQDMFEAVFNYFPITFKPPPDDPYGITAQDLKDRLRICIASNSDFAPHAFPQLLDKLDSTSMNTKRDVIQAIQACVTEYSPETVNLYSVTLWDALKFEILSVQEEDLAEGSLKALGLIAATLAKVNGEGPLNAYLRPIIKECNEHLEDAPTKQSQAAGRILHAVASASPLAADRVAKGVLPVLFALFNGSESITKRRGLLEVFNQVSKAYIELSVMHPSLSVETLQTFGNDALEAMLRALTNAPKAEVSFRLTSLDGLAQLTSIDGVLTENGSHRAVDEIVAVILHEAIDGHGNIRSHAVKTLTSMAHAIPDIIRDRSIPAFMAALPDVPSDLSTFATVLEAFAQLSSEQQIFDTIVLRLRNKLHSAMYQQASDEYQRALLLALLYCFSFGSPKLEHGMIRSKYYTDYAESLVNSVRDSVTSGGSQPALDVIGRICNIILRGQGVHFQSTVCHQDLRWISGSWEATGSPESSTCLLYYYAALRPEVLEAEEVITILRSQAMSALQAVPKQSDTTTILRLVSLLVNKFANPKAMRAVLEACNIEVETLLATQPENPQAVNLAFAVVKGLIIQGKSGALATNYMTILLKLLGTSDKTIARRFGILLAPDEILAKENHCVISGLYKQRIFNQTIPPLTESIRNADPAIKQNFLLALSGLLRWLPYAILEPHLTSLVPPLLQSLELPSSASEAKTSTLSIFESILMHNPQQVEEHTSSLVTRLLNCTATVDQGNSAAVRQKALQCLLLLPRQLKRENVVPYRRQVAKRLQTCLDDAKRNVRAEAVRCRTAWLGLDEGVDDED
nr:mms19 nucleotide excision repair protein like [Quercus suber]